MVSKAAGSKAAKEKLREQMSAFRTDFEKDFGSGTLRTGKTKVSWGVISTGSMELDLQTGVGGYVEGRITEIWGLPDLGKTSLALLACAEAQKKYPYRAVAYIDAENKMDEMWAEKLGIDRSRWELYVPQSAEDVSDAAKRFLDNPLFSMVVCDSVGALISRAEQEKNADEDVVANVARIVTRMVKHATLSATKNNAVFLILNQPRNQISRFATGLTSPGGLALKHCSTMKFRLSGSDKKAIEATINGERIPIGKEIAVRIERNKVAPAGQTVRVFFKNVETDKYGPIGVDTAQETVELAKRLRILDRVGNKWCSLDGETIASKWDEVLPWYREHPDELTDLRIALLDSKAVMVDEEALAPEAAPVVPEGPLEDTGDEEEDEPLPPAQVAATPPSVFETPPAVRKFAATPMEMPSYPPEML